MKPLISDLPIPIRAAFIKKVYSLLSLQLLFTFAVCGWFMFDENAMRFALSSQGSALNQLSIFGSIFSLIALFWCEICAPVGKRRYPSNLILLGLFTFFTAYQLGVLAAVHQAHGVGYLIFVSLGATLFIFSSLTAYVIVTQRDFDFLGPFLYIALICLVLFSVIFLFVPASASLYSFIFGYTGTLIFSGYVLYDTSRLIHRLGPDDYIEATVQLYLDAINLFVSLLNILHTTLKG